MTTDFKAIVARADCEAYSEFHWAQATEDRRALIALCREARELLETFSEDAEEAFYTREIWERRDAFLALTKELP